MSYSFIETQFPSHISYGARGGACFNTDIITSYSGLEQRNINWNKPRNKYNISLNNRTREEIETIIQFFYNVYGRAIGFRFKDWLDYKVDYRTGLISFVNIPEEGAVVTANFEFDVPVRFDTDELSISSDDLNCNSWSSINLIEIRM